VCARDYDLPRTIVWDAFVDETLVDGWLSVGSMAGEVIDLRPLERLVIETGSGILDFTLAEIPTGTRGTGTTVTVRVSTGDQDAATVAAAWERNLEQLEGLLRGHPVDWEAEDAGASAASLTTMG
jgi:uncharacterized protein YndB with AHSA1/START domain